MRDTVAGVVLAAGTGTRLRPLTLLRPKALCPVGDVPLVDLALERVTPAVAEVAVNIHHHRRAIDAHLPAEVHRSFEDVPLGTAGALGQLRGWLDGRAALVVNADAWCPGSLEDFVAGWDGARIRLLLAGDDELTPASGIAAALMPWPDIAVLGAVPSGLYELSWRAAQTAGRVEAVRHDGPFVDCGTPAQYLAANLAVADGQSAVGAAAVAEGPIDRSGAVVEGPIDRSVVGAGAVAEGRIDRSVVGAGAVVDGHVDRSVVGQGAVIDGHVDRSVVGAGAIVAGRVDRCVVWPDARIHAGEHLVDAIRADQGVTVLVRSAPPF